MNSKLIAIIAAVVIVAAAGGAAAYFLLKQDKEPDSDYTLLDSNDRIRPGLTLILTSSGKDYDYSDKAVVDSLPNGMVNFTEKTESENRAFGNYGYNLNDFVPSNPACAYTRFDYTAAQLPSGVEVSQEGNDYTIKGTYTVVNMGTTVKITYDSLKITYDGTNVSAVSGTATTERTGDDMKSKEVTEFKTENGQLLSKYDDSFETKEQRAIDEFYDYMIVKFDPNNFSGTEIVDSDGSYGNVDVKIHTVNGTVDERVYENYKFYCYNGYIIHSEGSINGNDMSMTLSIYVA